MGSRAHLREGVTRRGDASSEVGRASPRVKRPPHRGGQGGHPRTWPAPDSDGCRLLGAEPRGPAGRREAGARSSGWPCQALLGAGDGSPSGSRTVLNLQNRDEPACSGRPVLPAPVARAARDGRFVSDSVPGSAGTLNPHVILRAPQSTAAGPDSPTAEEAGLPFSTCEADSEASGQEAPGKRRCGQDAVPASGGGPAPPPGGGAG